MRLFPSLTLVSALVTSSRAAYLSPIAIEASSGSPTTALANTTRGVCLGGWLLLEQWSVLIYPLLFSDLISAAFRITPPLFAGSGASDEWSLSAALGKAATLRLLQRHWS